MGGVFLRSMSPFSLFINTVSESAFLAAKSLWLTTLDPSVGLCVQIVCMCMSLDIGVLIIEQIHFSGLT